MPLIIVKQFTFAAAHRLPNHKGLCRNLHGHRWLLEVGVSGEVDKESGMITDFAQLKFLVDSAVVSKLDHQYLNELTHLVGFPTECPTAENMIEWLVATLEQSLEPTDCRLAFLKLWESDNSYAEWRQ